MNSKYWTSGNNHKSIVFKSPTSMLHTTSGKKNINLDEVETSTATSIDDDMTIKTNTIHNGKRNEHSNVVTKESQLSSSKSSTSSIMKRPDSLELTFDYGSTTDLSKLTAIANRPKSSGGGTTIQRTITANNSVDVNQSKSLSVAGNKSHHDAKKSTTSSYDLWVNENVGMKEKSENSVAIAREKKLDLPGRVSFRYVKKFFRARNNYILLGCGIVNVKGGGFVAEVVWCSVENMAEKSFSSALSSLSKDFH